MSVPYLELTPQQFAERKDEFKSDNYEIEFVYHGKTRYGRIEAATDTLVTVALTQDGPDKHPPNDPQYKSFLFDNIEGDVEIYLLS